MPTKPTPEPTWFQIFGKPSKPGEREREKERQRVEQNNQNMQIYMVQKNVKQNLAVSK
jgi:hypothetical protein